MKQYFIGARYNFIDQQINEQIPLKLAHAQMCMHN